MHPILIRSYKVTQRSCTRGGHAQPRARLSGTLFSPPWAWGVARCTCTYRVVPYGCRRIKTSLVSKRFRRWLSLCETSGHLYSSKTLTAHKFQASGGYYKGGILRTNLNLQCVLTWPEPTYTSRLWCTTWRHGVLPLRAQGGVSISTHFFVEPAGVATFADAARSRWQLWFSSLRSDLLPYIGSPIGRVPAAAAAQSALAPVSAAAAEECSALARVPP